MTKRTERPKSARLHGVFLSPETLRNTLEQLQQARDLLDLAGESIHAAARQNRLPSDSLLCAASHLERITAALDGGEVVGFRPSHRQSASAFPSELFDSAQDAVIVWNLDGDGIVYWNPAASALYGFSSAEALGRSTHTLLSTELSGGVSALEAALARFGVWVGELRHTKKSGQKVTVESRLSLLGQHDGRWLVVEVNRDVTDRARAEAARTQSESQMAALRGRTAASSR
jgi:PAS domain S-box-containing protein